MDRFYWGIDLGGTKIECAVIERTTDQCVIRERISTESEQGYQHILQQIAILVDRCSAILGQRPNAIGFGTPGTLDPIHGVMKNCNSTALNGQTLDKDLEALLNAKVVLANDANCFALAETHFGVVKRLKPDAEVVFGIIMGTGVGSGIVVNGKGLYGRHGIAGEWGHNVIEPNGAPCYCGQLGCVETVISGKGLERFYFEQAGKKLSLPSIVKLADDGDIHAVTTMERLSFYFGLAAAQIINVLDPDVIVIGGGVGNIDYLYQTAEQAILPHLFNSEMKTLIVKPDLGDSAGVFGAAALVK